MEAIGRYFFKLADTLAPDWLGRADIKDHGTFARMNTGKAGLCHKVNRGPLFLDLDGAEVGDRRKDGVVDLVGRGIE